jgi:hypothetical protein
LIHNSIGLGLTQIVAVYTPFKWFAPVLPATFLIGLAWVISRYVEPTIKVPLQSIGASLKLANRPTRQTSS